MATREREIGNMRGWMQGIPYCMLTTIGTTGELRSRPMTLQQGEFTGELWFFASRNCDAAVEIRRDARVNVTFCAADGDHFISASGRGRVVDDAAQKHELWNPLPEKWFPNGKDDPEVILIKMEVETSEYWESSTGTVAHLSHLAPAALMDHARSKL